MNDHTYVVTGKDMSGRRFRHVYFDEFTAMHINLWQGSVWKQDARGRRQLLKRVLELVMASHIVEIVGPNGYAERQVEVELDYDPNASAYKVRELIRGHCLGTRC